MTDQELKPCPFCSSTNLYFELYSSGYYTIECGNCLTKVTLSNEKRAKIAWNTRPIEDKLGVVIEEVEKLIAKIPRLTKEYEYMDKRIGELSEQVNALLELVKACNTVVDFNGLDTINITQAVINCRKLGLAV